MYILNTFELLHFKLLIFEITYVQTLKHHLVVAEFEMEKTTISYYFH